MLVPYLAVLIPIGALACIAVIAQRRRPTRWLAVVTGLVAPVLLVYALARGGGDVFRVLHVGAYLTLACSLALVATGLGLFASRWGRAAIAVLALLVLAAFLVPAVAQDDVDSRVYAAYAADRTTLAPSEPSADDEVVAPPPRSVPTTTTTSATTPPTTAALVTTSVQPEPTTGPPNTGVQTASSGCPGRGPTESVTSFNFDQVESGGDQYYVDVRGTIRNSTGATITVSSIQVAVRSNGAEVGRISITANDTLRSGETLNFFSDDQLIQSPGSPPSSADVVAAPDHWSDARFASCPRP
jgi:hypothetical protein